MLRGDSLCLHCTGVLSFSDVMGWVHVDGHGAVWRRCAVCDYSGSDTTSFWANSTSEVCPRCGVAALRDHHVATPDLRSVDA